MYDLKSDPQNQTDWSTDYAVPRKGVYEKSRRTPPLIW